MTAAITATAGSDSFKYCHSDMNSQQTEEFISPAKLRTKQNIRNARSKVHRPKQRQSRASSKRQKADLGPMLMPASMCFVIIAAPAPDGLPGIVLQQQKKSAKHPHTKPVMHLTCVCFRCKFFWPQISSEGMRLSDAGQPASFVRVCAVSSHCLLLSRAESRDKAKQLRHQKLSEVLSRLLLESRAFGICNGARMM